MTDQPADLLAAAAQRLRDHIAADKVAIFSPAAMDAVARLIDGAARSVTAAETAAAQVWPDDPDARTAWIARQQPDAALAVARAVLGQDGGQK
ncbi:hypothetical protein ACGF07_25635 [Kitasatospora sp. NPDC048194]|uniref:hypothetical protein n=1 Tax=Kitasatospora sp. NPDC048194 TaxID=3364045 RepID=UPI0037221999